MTPKILRGNFPAENWTSCAFMCSGPWWGGVGIGLFMREKVVNCIHILDWNRVCFSPWLGTGYWPHMLTAYFSLFITIYTTFGVLESIYHMTIGSPLYRLLLSRLDYCNGLLYCTPADHLGKLQRLQNAAARLACTVSRYDHITPSLINLHWLPITHRRGFKIAMLVHICIYVRRRTTASFSLDLIKIKESSKYVAPKVWNRHPLEIRQCQSLNTFKVLLKTHLLKLAFY